MNCEEFLKQYALGEVFSIKKDELGSGENYIIEAESGKYFAKLFRAGDTFNFPEQEIETVNFLRKKGVPVVEFLANKNGEYLTKIGNTRGHLQRFIQGRTYTNNTLPQNVLMESAIILGNIHTYLYPQTDKNDTCFLKKIANVQRNLKDFEAIFQELKNKNDDVSKTLMSDVEYRIKLLDKYCKVDLENIFKDFTFGTTHGDYNCRQFLINDGKISAVLDFSMASNKPYIWEVVRSYTIGSEKCKNGDIDFSDFEKYLGEYSKNFKLKEFDLEYAWEMYKIQLAGSPFGYYEYVYKNNPNVLGFASWRTKVVRAIEEQKSLKRFA